MNEKEVTNHNQFIIFKIDRLNAFIIEKKTCLDIHFELRNQNDWINLHPTQDVITLYHDNHCLIERNSVGFDCLLKL